MPPIPGVRLDPPPKEIAAITERIEARSQAAGLGYRAAMRFNLANASLLAAGTTYYLFLAVFALTALAFGIASLLGAQKLQELVDSALNQMFPGMIGNGGLDAANLQSFGQGTSAIGLLVLLYSGGGAMSAAKTSIHLVFGAPKDSRNFVHARFVLTLWMLVVAPLILVSFAPVVVLRFFAEPVISALGLGGFGGWALGVGGTALALVLDFAIIYLLLSTLGGIRPSRSSRVGGAVVGAICIEILKALTSAIVAWSISKPQYGAFAVPITALLLLYLQTVVLYVSAALTAGIAERGAPAAAVPGPEAGANLTGEST